MKVFNMTNNTNSEFEEGSPITARAINYCTICNLKKTVNRLL